MKEQKSLQSIKNQFDKYKIYSQKQRQKHLQDIYQIKQSKQIIPDPFNYHPYSISYFINHNNKKIATYSCLPQNPKAILIYIHGLNSFTETSGYIAQQLKKEQIATFGFDQQGFGRSQGDRGVIYSIENTINDAIQFIQNVQSQFPKLKTFISGSSLGGALCFQISIKKPNLIQGVIFFAPAIKDNKLNSPVGKFFAKLLNFILPKSWRTLEQNFQNGCKYECAKNYLLKNQFLYNDRIILSSVCQTLTIMESCENKFDQFSHPFLAFQGTVDKLVDPFGIIDLFNRCKSKDKTVFMIQNMWHSIWIQPQISTITVIMTNWINEHLQ